MPVFPLYVDPTSAGLGLQMLLAGAVGSLVTIRLFWGRVFSLFRRTEQESEETMVTSETPDASEEEA